MSLQSVLSNLRGSRSTDKLVALVALADATLERDKQLSGRLKSVELTWSERSGELLPCVKVEFKDPAPTGGVTSL